MVTAEEKELTRSLYEKAYRLNLLSADDLEAGLRDMRYSDHAISVMKALQDLKIYDKKPEATVETYAYLFRAGLITAENLYDELTWRKWPIREAWVFVSRELLRKDATPGGELPEHDPRPGVIIEPPTPPPEPTPGATGFFFSSEPSGVNVFISDVFQGDTPLEVKGLTGGQSYPVRFSLEGYEDLEVSLVAEDGKVHVADYTLTEVIIPPPPPPPPPPPIEETGFAFVTEPAGAAVYIGDTFQGYTPYEVTGLVGGQIYEIGFKLTGYKDKYFSVMATAGAITPQEEILVPISVPESVTLTMNEGDTVNVFSHDVYRSGWSAKYGWKFTIDGTTDIFIPAFMSVEIAPGVGASHEGDVADPSAAIDVTFTKGA